MKITSVFAAIEANNKTNKFRVLKFELPFSQKDSEILGEPSGEVMLGDFQMTLLVDKKVTNIFELAIDEIREADGYIVYYSGKKEVDRLSWETGYLTKFRKKYDFYQGVMAMDITIRPKAINYNGVSYEVVEAETEA